MENELMNFGFEKGNSNIIKVIGVGGSGGNAVNHMFNKGINGVDFVVCNTDEQALRNSPIDNKIQLGTTLTQGLGAGNEPNQGREAARESYDDIAEMLSHNAKMVFVTAGMGGGTGTGAAPVIAQQAKDMGILTVGIVTLPFRFEGNKRKRNAIEGLKEMRKSVDALLVIDNEKIREIYGDCRSSQAFGYADDILTLAAKGIAEIITVHGIINVDFADVKTVMTDSGIALMGSASATGEGRAIEAIEKAMHSPLLCNNDIRGAKNILLNIISSSEHESTMDEVCGINDYVQEAAGNNADIIWGNTIDDSLGEALSVTVIATGFEDDSLSDFLPEQPKKKEVEVLRDEPKVNINVEKPAKGVETGFQTNFPTNDPDKIERVVLEDITPMDYEKRQAVLDFGQGDNSLQNSFTQAKPLRYGTEQDVLDMESQPAYMRLRKQAQDQEPAADSGQPQMSHMTLSSDGKLRENNSFLFDNVD
ncbi:MAG: cell division protein FtsZ [Salinivirgaceae bacterium]|nr:cell division protein FtsZ [Salinivirgaceae bacterium]